MTYLEMLKQFPTEREAVDYFIKIRYGGKIFCNHCGSTRVYSRKGKGKLYGCSACKSTFSPFTDTLFENSPTDFRKCLYALYLVHNGDEGISAEQLGREIDVTRRTAQRMIEKIRAVMENGEE